MFPAASITGIDTKSYCNAIANQNIAKKGLAHRIKIRQMLVGDLPDEDRFDFVWFPLIFMNTPTLIDAMPALLRAVKPGGWVLNITFDADGSDITAVRERLKAYMWGANVRNLAASAAPFLADGSGWTSYTAKSLGKMAVFVVQKKTACKSMSQARAGNFQDEPEPVKET
eukprot:gnl/TRDRNA2_/TRDRNA2_146156_c0_seq1.p1 gnl/TRDRNA2_/TRDRNA2_146156_c0~~gnl/TRDRNA2_/TRDRNA2_146156_c0_seq1.p1  ORF type:complete len:181 (+),score=36.93 gnl/TRDRNA2_/TRDRNA2_146156_c0_seq1:34-543(+)